jgi:hypothetical protein
MFNWVCDPFSKKRSLGFAHLFRPRYAGANLGHPSIASEAAMTKTPKGRLKVAQHVVLGQLRAGKSVPTGTAESHTPPSAVPGGTGRFVSSSTQDCVLGYFSGVPPGLGHRRTGYQFRIHFRCSIGFVTLSAKKRSLGFAHLFRPRYAGAFVGNSRSRIIPAAPRSFASHQKEISGPGSRRYQSAKRSSR